jgi:hypothetical protein
MVRLALAVLLVSLAGDASAAPRWTFCVARTGAEVWISDVFAADTSRDKLEGAFRSAVARLGATGAEARCPSPRADETVAADARTGADAFTRQTGATVHAVAAGDFSGRSDPRADR